MSASSTRDQALQALQVDLRSVDARLELADRLDDDLIATIEDALARMEELGITALMSPAESTRASIENLGTMLDDWAGVAALRQALRLGARIIQTIRTTGLYDWWENAEPEVLIASAASSQAADLFDAFGSRVSRELGNQWNMGVFTTPRVDRLENEELLPPVHGVVTNHAAYREWTLGWGGHVVWWEPTAAGFQLQLYTRLGAGSPEGFLAEQLDDAAARVYELLIEPDAGLDAITITEHRALESLITAVEREMPSVKLAAEDRVRLDVLIETLQLQLRTPTPDRTIIGRALRGVAMLGGTLLVGVAANYLTDLLRRFGVPWP
jgi:hypothetical protein